MAFSVRAWEQHTGRTWTNSSHIPLKERTPFPWERQGIFDELLAADPTALEGVDASELNDFKFDAERWRSRLPKDTFGDSLKKVNRLYNKVFGYSARKVIAHMPHFIDRTIMEDLTKMFPEEWKETSSHRLRSGEDMQYAFAYFRYVMELEKNFSVSEAFGLLDLDNSGLLSVHELRTLITRLYDLPTSPENWHKFEAMLLNCSAGQEPMDSLGVGIGPDSSEVWVTLELVQNCTLLTDELKRATGKQHVYRHELESDEHDITFEMIRDNVTDVLSQLDAVRKQPKKFVCLNDNIDHRKKTAVDVVDALHNFYQSFFPVRSQFELPIGLRNRFLHKQDLRDWQDRQHQVIGGSKVALVAVGLVLIAFLYSGSLKRMRRSWLLSRRHRRVTSTRQPLGRSSSSSGTGPAYGDKRV
jgi:UDP-N-acetylglucosamine-lysosomal-enzyme